MTVSVVRTTAFNIFTKLDTLASKYIKHEIIKRLVNTLVRPRIQNLILRDISEAELKQVLNEAYQDLKPIFENIKTAEMIKDSRKVNTGKMQNFVESLPDYKKYLELVD